MLNRYFEDKRDINAKIENYKSQIREIENALKPIEDELAPYYQQIKEMQQTINDLNDSLYQGYYMEVKNSDGFDSWIEKIGELVGTRKVGQFRDDIYFVQISNNTKIKDAYSKASEIVREYNNDTNNDKRELLCVINFTKNIVFNGEEIITLDEYMLQRLNEESL
ncbi:hypothetical protein ACFSCX_06180 [Bacillus salitolerans]|uniref:Uncharacterized protein n=1 Tax=Bacillus salitolerans TaxID=1437434 RepID=A0ABW4LN13_9BACI